MKGADEHTTIPASAHTNQPEIAEASFSVPAKFTRFQEDEKKSLLSGPTSITAPPLSFGRLDNPSDAPVVEEINRRPADLEPIPSSQDHWPPIPIKIACPNCGLYTHTLLEAETECVGFMSLFSDGPLFRDTLSHYCPRCNQRLGHHYTGASCGRGLGCCSSR